MVEQYPFKVLVLGSSPSHSILNKFMTASKKSKQQPSEYVSSRQWSMDCLEKIKLMQDEYLDRYYDDVECNNNMLTLLQKLVEQLEKNLK